MTSFFERIMHIAEIQGYKNPNDFAKNGLGWASPEKINRLKDENKMPSVEILLEISNKFEKINAEWLLTGRGSMLKEDEKELSEKENLPLAAYTENPNEGIPLIPLDAMGGVASGETSIFEIECERYIIPMFRGADFLIPVKGSSMIPKYNSGDVVACKNVPMKDIFFQWNKVYVLDTNQGPIIKRVGKSEEKDCIKIISENPKYEPFDLHLSQIYSIAIVMGVVRLE